MLEVKDLCFGYIKEPLCLKDVNFVLERGQSLGVFGGERAGKSSLLKVMCGLESLYAGFIKYDSRELHDIMKSELSFSYLPSEPVLLNKTIKDNLEFLFQVLNKPFDEEKVKEVFSIFSFNFPLKTKVKKLSLKDKRILAIIRSYIKNSKYIFIDDQCEGLGEEDCTCIKNAILTLINAKSSVKTTILAFNNEKSIMETDKKIYLSFSKAISFSSLDELFDIDIFAFNYLNYPLKKFILMKKENYFLFDYKIEGKKNEVITNQYKLNNKFDFKLEEGDRLYVEFFSRKSADNLTDQEIDKQLCSGQAHLFDSATGDKLI